MQQDICNPEFVNPNQINQLNPCHQNKQTYVM